jgi:uncharacterized protein (TIGR02996 family)
MNLHNLSTVLRYSQSDKVGFEKAIDENPMDSVNHLVYADWLDENGEHDEADFRRSMGEWLADGRFIIPEHQREAGDSVTHPFAVSEEWGDPDTQGIVSYPRGVGALHIPSVTHTAEEDHPANGEVHPGLETVPTDGSVPDHFAHWHPSTYPPYLAWRSYRDMEGAFKKSFMHNRKTVS